MEKRPLNNFRPKFQKKQEHRINNLITHPEVRITGDGIETKICSLSEAIALSEAIGLDLVEINSTTNPPICKIVDYGKFLYEKKKKEKENSSGNKTTLKEIRLGPNTQDNDLVYRSKQAIDFLKEGHKVKISMKFRGREMAFKSKGEIIILKFLQTIEEVGKPEYMPKMEGNNMFVTVTPKNASKK